MTMNKCIEQIHSLNLAFAATEQQLTDEIAALSQREQQVAVRLLAVQQQAEQEKVEQARLLSEQADTLRSEYAEREQALTQQLQAGQQEFHRLEQERLTREQTLHEQTSQARQEIENILRTQVQREQDVAAQLLAVHQQAEREKAELVRNHSEQERAMHSQHAGREKEHAEQTRQVRLELDTLLRQQVLREQQVAAELLAAQLEKAELARSHTEQARALHSQHVEREQSLNDQLLIRQQELHQQHQNHTDRAQEVAEKLLAMALQQQAAESAAEQAHSQREQERKLHLLYAEREEKLKQQLQDRQQDLQNLQKDRARREQEMGEQLLALQQQAAHEMVEQAQKHLEQASALHHLHAEREQSLIQERQAGQQDLRRLEQDQVQREQDHAEQISQSQQELKSLLRDQAQREQEINAQLLTIRQQAQQEMVEHTRLLDACTALEARLQAEMQSGQQASTHLRHLLAEVQHNLDLAHASLSWRMTAPLRKLAGMFGSPKNQARIPVGTNSTLTSELGMPVAAKVPPIPASSSAGDPIPSEQSTQASTETLPIAANPKPLEPTIPPLVQAAATHMPTIASTLSELLAYHDQQFVCCAYQTLLGRAPDPEGLSYYLGRVRTGFSKIQIVAQLFLSHEGKAYAAKLSGLDMAIQHYQKGQRPLVGVLFRYFNGVEGNHPIERKLRAIENKIFLLNDESRSRFDQLEIKLSNLHHLVAQQAPFTAAAPDIVPVVLPETLQITPAQDKESNHLRRLSPRSRSIYLQLKSAAAVLAKRKA